MYPTDRLEKPGTPVLWLAFSIVLLGVLFVVGWVSLWHRESRADKQHELERRGVCTLLLQIPQDRRTPAVTDLLTDYRCPEESP